MHLPDFKEARTRDIRPYKRIEFKEDSKVKNKYQGKTFYLKTYGCQMNEHDSENIEALLIFLGFSKVDDYKNADLVLLNTCSIRENAHNKAFGMLGRLKHLKQEKKDLIVGLCGCMAQEASVVDSILRDYKWVNFVFGTHNMYQLPEIIDKAIEENKQQIEVFSREGDLIEGLPVLRVNNYKAYVNIIYGCNKFCTYCIVPYTRGRERSRLKEDVLAEVQKLVDDGYKEVTLLGQNVNAYGKDLYDDYTMANLLEDVAKMGIPRIRFTTSHPWDFTDEMIDVIAKYDNIMPSVHLPVQSGSSRILKLMGRRYTKESYLELFHKIKDKVPGVTISTDIIVGFPGETEEEFNKTYEFLKEIKFYKMHIFKYSPRKGTKAAQMPNQVDGNIKEERSKKLIDLSDINEKEYNKAYINKEVEVLFEEEKDCICKGHTKNYILAYCENNECLQNKILKMQCKKIEDNHIVVE